MTNAATDTVLGAGTAAAKTPPSPTADPVPLASGSCLLLLLGLAAAVLLVPILHVGGLLLSLRDQWGQYEREDEEARGRYEREDEEARGSGDLIVAALGRYREAEGHYPGKLDDLVPRYLDVAPAPGLRNWCYVPDKEDGSPGFLLYCSSAAPDYDIDDNHAHLVYDSGGGRWSERYDPYVPNDRRRARDR